ncbi:hypothetical protein HUS23_12940 [Ectothiorhodospiraceae bacterium 2226]|nr:hypothetical protein HUS23_12940 [Ectothiorhodospiraceae bacterium 2226]
MSTTEPDFLRAYRGGFTGVLRWPQLEGLWETVRAAPDGWYIYATGEPPPREPASPEDLVRFLSELDALLRRDHAHDYCGIVYADDLRRPAFIKVYDPNNLGSVCGSAPGGPPPPAWVLSTLIPVELATALPQPAGRRRWWQSLFARRV